MAHEVLQNNCSALDSILDVREMITEAFKKQLITRKEKEEIEQTSVMEGTKAGAEKMLEILCERNAEEGEFQLFCNVLEASCDHSVKLRGCAEATGAHVSQQRPHDKRSNTISVSPSATSHWKTNPIAATLQVPCSLSNTEGRESPLEQELVDLSHTIDIKVKNTPETKRKRETYSLPSDFQQSPEVALLCQFLGAQDCSVKVVDAFLESNEKQCRLQNIYDSNLRSFLHIASNSMGFRIIKLLIEKYNFDPNEQDGDGNTPLHIACEAHKTQTVMYLCSLTTCDPNITNGNGDTPLHIAAQNGSVILMRYLLKMAGLDLDVRDKDGRTAIEIVEQEQRLVPSASKTWSPFRAKSLPSSSGYPNCRISFPTVMSAPSPSHNMTGAEFFTFTEYYDDHNSSEENYNDYNDGNPLFEGVILRDKSTLKSRQTTMCSSDDEESVCGLTTLSHVNINSNAKALLVERNKKLYRMIAIARLCMLGKNLSYLVLSILVALLMVAVFLYLLLT